MNVAGFEFVSVSTFYLKVHEWKVCFCCFTERSRRRGEETSGERCLFLMETVSIVGFSVNLNGRSNVCKNSWTYFLQRIRAASRLCVKTH